MLPVLAFLPGEVALPMEQLRQAVPGLAGITGLLMFPMLGAWARLALQAIEWGRPGINRTVRGCMKWPGAVGYGALNIADDYPLLRHRDLIT